jgi:hypothetical protein
MANTTDRKRKKPNLFIGTPAYNSKVHTAYLHSALEFAGARLAFSIYTIGNESLITRGRNSVVSRFAALEQFTHLLFLDADIALGADGLKKLLDREKDVIGAPVPLKAVTPKGPVYNMGRIIDREGVVARTDKIGTAVLLLSRAAVEALVEDARKDGRVYAPNPLGQTGEEDTQQYDVFQVGVRDGQYLSEDFWVCERLRELGFDIHVDLSVKPRHYGVYEF